MTTLTKNEKRILLVLFKEFTIYYNANSISKKIGISSVGAYKIFKRLKAQNVLISKKIGKSIVYKLNLENSFVEQLLIFLLNDETNDFQRWKEEFSNLYQHCKMVLLFGSTVKNSKLARDLDILIVMGHDEQDIIDKILSSKQEILPKKIHAIKLTNDDLNKNLQQKNRAFVDIIENAVVLSGQQEYVKVMKSVTSI